MAGTRGKRTRRVIRRSTPQQSPGENQTPPACETILCVKADAQRVREIGAVTGGHCSHITASSSLKRSATGNRCIAAGRARRRALDACCSAARRHGAIALVPSQVFHALRVELTRKKLIPGQANNLRGSTCRGRDTPPAGSRRTTARIRSPHVKPRGSA